MGFKGNSFPQLTQMFAQELEMNRNSTICFIVLCLTGLLRTMAASEVSPLIKLSISQLKQRLIDIDSEIDQLAICTLRAGVGAVGYRSKIYMKPNSTEWIRIDLKQEVPVDQIVLVPSLWRDPQIGVQADGFPATFRILAGTANTTNIVASFTPEDNILPRIAPLVVDCPQPLHADWVLVEATMLTPGSMQRRYVLQFSEIMIFSGNENVALGQTVDIPISNLTGPGRSPVFLVDGFLPYLMDARHGEISWTFNGPAERSVANPSFTIDLGEAFPVNQINLHNIDLNHNIPLTQLDGFGVPRAFHVTGANRSDFSDEVLLFEYQRLSVSDSGPIISRRFPETSCRYIRLNAPTIRRNQSIGFAEIEVLSKGENISVGKPVTSIGFPHSEEELSKITDGRNYYGNILPMRVWMNQLARRHDLENERPLVEAALNYRYARQKTHLNRIYWLGALFAAAVGFFILVERMKHHRQLEKMRTRFAADLHDELGANIHSIGLLSDFAEKSINSPEKLRPYLERIRKLTERTGVGIRHCTDLLEAEHLFSDLKIDMQRNAERIVAELNHQFTVEGEQYLEQLSPRARKDLFLFYKESLININRHADASEIITHLSGDRYGVKLTVADNGCGITNIKNDGIPSSLKRRAKLLKAQLSVESSPEIGTKITLQLCRKWGFNKVSPF
jgi:signal transduction histidine kinase